MEEAFMGWRINPPKKKKQQEMGNSQRMILFWVRRWVYVYYYARTYLSSVSLECLSYKSPVSPLQIYW